MIQAVSVEPRTGYRILLRCEDGAEGEVDLSDMAGRGVFKAWNEPGRFEQVHVAPHGAISWGDGLELCRDALYLELTGKPFGELP